VFYVPILCVTAMQAAVIPMDSMQDASRALRQNLKSVDNGTTGRKAEKTDPTLALFAAWSQVRERSIDFDAFIQDFEKQTEVTAPSWWKNRLRGVKYTNSNESYLTFDLGNLPADNDQMKIAKHSLVDLKLKDHRVSIDMLKVVTPGCPFRISVLPLSSEKKWEAPIWSLGTDLIP
jgi:hypothetical protein